MEQMHSKIIAMAVELDCVVFGGYVRDLISKDVPKDIDIRWVPTTWYTRPFDNIVLAFTILRKFLELSEDSRIDRILTGYNKDENAELNIVIKMTIGGVKVDLMVARDHKILEPDVNVNQLEMYGDELNIRVHQFDKHIPGFTMIEILNSIHKREYVKAPTCSSTREENIKEKGYTEKQ